MVYGEERSSLPASAGGVKQFCAARVDDLHCKQYRDPGTEPKEDGGPYLHGYGSSC